MKARIFTVFILTASLAFVLKGAVVAQNPQPAFYSKSDEGMASASASANVELVSQIGDDWDSWDVAVSGDFAYVADDTSGLRVISISNPSAPVEVGRYATDASGVAVSGDYAYVAAYGGGLRIINVANPSSPTEVGSYNTPGQAYSVVVSGTYAYVADGSAGLRIIHVSNPEAPTEAGFYDTPGTAHEVAVVGNYAYVAEGEPPDSFVGLRVINVSNPGNPTLSGSLDLGGLVCEGVAVADGYAYVTTWSGGLHIVNVSDPENPWEVSAINPSGTERGVTVVDHYAYLASSNLYIVDVSSPASPELIGTYGTGRSLRDLAVVGRYVFVAEEYARLVILWHAFPASADIPVSGGTLTVPADSTHYLFPANTFTDIVVITHTARFPGNAPSTGNLTGISHFFDVTAVYSSTGQPAYPTQPYTITVQYTDTEKGPAIEETLGLYWWDGSDWSQEGITSTVNTVNNMVTAQADHFSLFAVLGETRRVYLPLVLRNY